MTRRARGTAIPGTTPAEPAGHDVRPAGRYTAVQRARRGAPIRRANLALG
ncbi:hypothetical protein GXW74_01650 [Roseomonas eburnea]|uniref:Uncharacterized protein n=1 Tax=Neoroseomonas eburnea TaxID=1346889 RepID=A0A9X9X639_9PROT|nr:hypothetical protein [Neoroseomonas eburnea]MBR0679175.1 hypothetical protein [Neoroseomonas eburnea]